MPPEKLQNGKLCKGKTWMENQERKNGQRKNRFFPFKPVALILHKFFNLNWKAVEYYVADRTYSRRPCEEPAPRRTTLDDAMASTLEYIQIQFHHSLGKHWRFLIFIFYNFHVFTVFSLFFVFVPERKFHFHSKSTKPRNTKVPWLVWMNEFRAAGQLVKHTAAAESSCATEDKALDTNLVFGPQQRQCEVKAARREWFGLFHHLLSSVATKLIQWAAHCQVPIYTI